MRLLLARHGRTDWNEAGRYQGQSDPPLSPEGEAEAQALAESLCGAGITRILTSPLERAAATAGIVARTLGLAPPLADDRLTELGYGAWEGLTQAEVKLRWPDLLRRWKRAPETVQFPGGEDLATVQARLLRLLETRPWDIPVPAGGGVLLVTHTGPIRLLRLAAEGRPPAEFRQIEVPPASLHELRLLGLRLTPACPAREAGGAPRTRATQNPQPA